MRGGSSSVEEGGRRSCNRGRELVRQENGFVGGDMLSVFCCRSEAMASPLASDADLAIARYLALSKAPATSTEDVHARQASVVSSVPT